jgi:hypothetical protein
MVEDSKYPLHLYEQLHHIQVNTADGWGAYFNWVAFNYNKAHVDEIDSLTNQIKSLRKEIEEMHKDIKKLKS